MTDCTTIPVPIYGYRMYLYGIKSLVLLVTVYLSLRILSVFKADSNPSFYFNQIYDGHKT
jgi:hypothetical protein